MAVINPTGTNEYTLNVGETYTLDASSTSGVEDGRLSFLWRMPDRTTVRGPKIEYTAPKADKERSYLISGQVSERIRGGEVRTSEWTTIKLTFKGSAFGRVHDHERDERGSCRRRTGRTG